MAGAKKKPVRLWLLVAALKTPWGLSSAKKILERHYLKNGTLTAKRRSNTKRVRPDRLVHQGIHLLERFAQDHRIRIHEPTKNLQLKVLPRLPSGSYFLAYVDAIGELDGTRCIIDWKPTTAR
jgi:hypothetical protein